MTEPIPLVDLQAQYRALKAEIDRAVLDVLARGRFILGPEVQALEREVAAYCGAAHAVALASGTDALELALRACGVGPGDEVITTAYSFYATGAAIAYVGATPVFVDIEPETCNLDPAAVRAAVTPRTKALLPVHLFGHPCAIDAVCAVADAHGLAVIEDCAQAIGAAVGARRVGSFGRVGVFSFYPSKNLGAYGDGGMAVTNDAALAETLRVARDYGTTDRQRFGAWGKNSRLDELQAAILRVKLPHLERWTEARRRHAARYRALLLAGGLDEAALPRERDGCRHVYHSYGVRVANRSRVREQLAAQGVASYPYYAYVLPAQPLLGDRCGGYPHAEAAAGSLLALPMYPELTDAQVQRVAHALSALVAPSRR